MSRRAKINERAREEREEDARAREEREEDARKKGVMGDIGL